MLYLLITDLALREAIIEQLASAGLGDMRVVETVPALLKHGAGQADSVIVIDAASYDDKTAAALRDGATRPAVLVLGDAGDTELVTESFPKPFRLGHLLTRLRYYVETAPLLRDQTVVFGDYRLEPQNRRLTDIKNNLVIRLTEKETALLAYLAGCAQPASRRDILAHVWGYDERIDTHTLETHLYQLRRKLDDKGEPWLICDAGTYRLARGAL